MIRWLSCGLVAVAMLLFGACRRSPSAEAIASALAATNAVFVAPRVSPVTLSHSQLRHLKEIVNRFNQPAEVRAVRRDDRIGFPYGVFELDSVRFMWEGSQLYVEDSTSGIRFYVVDEVLGQMSERLMGALGDGPPLREVTSEQWQVVLSTLERSD